jgi:hypothetical protein
LGARLAIRAKDDLSPMSKPKNATEQGMLRTISRRYKRDGYRVTVPADGAPAPAFLEGFQPDLIAESDHDRVIIEVKQTNALRGANELQAIAERVSREPGWRFELVTVPSIETLSLPAAERMDAIVEQARAAMRAGLTDTAYAFAWMVLEVLVNDLALQNELKPAKKPFALIARDLVSSGIISRDVLDAIEQVHSIRNQIVHAPETFMPTAANVEKLLALSRRLREELVTAETT